MPDLITAAALAACWGTVIAVWCAGAAFNSIRGPRGRIRDRAGDTVQIGATALSAAVVLASRGYWRTWAFDVPWVQGLGLAVLLISTDFALWARLELGTDYSWQSETQYDLSRSTNTLQPAYGIWNAYVAIADRARGWRLAVVGKNLSDKSYSQQLLAGANTQRSVPRDDHRYWGVTFRYQF